LSLRAIGIKLDKLEPPPTYKNRTSKCWHASKIRRILENEVYIGRLYYQKIRVEWGKRIPQPKEKWIRIDVPELAIIDEDTFKAVQKRAQRNREKAKRNRKRKYLLVGHIRCADCGRPVNGNACTGKKGKLTYYRCSSYTKKYVNCPQCNRAVRTYKIDEPVWDWLVWLLSDDENLKTGLRELVEKRKNELNPKLEKLESIEELISDTENKIHRLVSELSKYDDEVVLLAIRKKINTESTNRESLENEKTRLGSELSQLVISEEMEEQIMKLAAQVREKLPGASYEEKRRILDMLEVQIVLYYGHNKDMHLEINCQIPTPSSKFPHNQGSGEDVFIVSRTS
jgi:site-specific DNA recombinase